MPQAGGTASSGAFDSPRLLGEALIRLADVQDSKRRLQARLTDALPYAAIGKAVTTSNRSVSLRNALNVVREVKPISMTGFFTLLRAVHWVKRTPGDSAHRPTKEAIRVGYVERVYFPGNRGYWPAITPTGIELLKYALMTGKYDVLEIKEDKK